MAKPLQYCKVISLQLKLKKNWAKQKKKVLKFQKSILQVLHKTHFPLKGRFKHENTYFAE